jgi:hypothetical protein
LQKVFVIKSINQLVLVAERRVCLGSGNFIGERTNANVLSVAI